MSDQSPQSDIRRAMQEFAAEGMRAHTHDLIAALLTHQQIPPRHRLEFPSVTDSPAGRPGRGGRKPRRARGNIGKVRNVLVERYGEPVYAKRDSRHEVAVYSLNPDGDGMICARLSSTDVNRGETVKIQVEQGAEFCEQTGMTPKFVCVALRADRCVEYEERLDFQVITELCSRGEIGWVTFRAVERVAREASSAMRFFGDMGKLGLTIYSTSEGGEIDWKSEKLQVTLRALMAESEADAIRTRNMAAVERRILGEGRPYNTSVPIGFVIDPDGYLSVDDDQFDVVREMYELYLEDPAHGPPMSFEDIHQHYATRGVAISAASVSAILRDRRYVTGVTQTQYAGKLWTSRVIPGFVGISEEAFAAVQQRRSTRGGKDTVTPTGLFCLNAIRLLHAPCRDIPAISKRRASNPRRRDCRPTSRRGASTSPGPTASIGTYRPAARTARPWPYTRPASNAR